MRHADLKPSDIDVAGLLPDDRSHRCYIGSLTTPPLTENIEWYVLAEHVALSHDGMQALHERYPHDNRKVQPMYDRRRSTTRTDAASSDTRRARRDLPAVTSALWGPAQNPSAKRAVQLRSGPRTPGRWSKPRLQLPFGPPSASRCRPNTPPEPTSGASGNAAQASAPV